MKQKIKKNPFVKGSLARGNGKPDHESRQKPVRIGRDAETGKFITVEETLKRPKTTTVETMKRRKQPCKD